ncbi:DUF6884 domain-containing protein [Ornithinimicrobium sediminis]|uniref:DUF6884 domain-containing protein n=1 Tax=Ornithinimicrobium sediminis TaxID=2904603 RepID=UPI001E3FA4F1|nr:DUF6884 domain-containing protein [Ornithinimicrobium sediminis]MCE0488131.1 hypothetical protein [Ornithinimicrobium sediminis]
MVSGAPAILFTLAGHRFELTADDVRAQLARQHPEQIQQYWVEIDGVRWSVKQVIALTTGLDRSNFQSQNSRRLLARLGFPIGKGNTTTPIPSGTGPVARRRAEGAAHRRANPPADVVLVGCVRSKRSDGAPAKDLYTSDYFAKMRAYAATSGLPWFILSAEHGLVRPDAWLEPYDCYLPDMDQTYRHDWGQKVATHLQRAIGPLGGVVIDIHAGAAYVKPVETAVGPLGAVVTDQLKGLSFGRRLAWYLQHSVNQQHEHDVVARLRDPSRAATPRDFLAAKGSGLRSPGVYSWWVDETGAEDLSKGLRHGVEAGLVYAGLAGATRSGGSSSTNTLWGRIATMHLGSRYEFSTLRRSLGSALARAHGSSVIDEADLTRWMHAHLRVVAIPIADADTLGDLETAVLAQLDPPLNLAKVPRTPLRRQLSALRQQYAGEAPSRAHRR